ncbi:ATP-binding protein [Streptomyces sp. ISL-1]|uniref:ATP-binding protein n=1 Tax=Streptomyces sp. ISL-1 TaxID=2817657 RepID=UPI001BEA3CAB|nr:ATP-binding protein [Streptomyces sp. ISL-1]MBT2392327.1 ATP-binding protein [Streptomyces sp. ISL-1]
MQTDTGATANVPQPASPAGWFTQLLSTTRRGARRARLLAEQQLADWGLTLEDETAQNAVLIVAELAANAVRHGRVPGRDFRLTLSLGPDDVLRIEVTDARAERLPEPASPEASRDPSAENGRGLLIVAALADSWGVDPCPEPPAHKTIWAELAPTRRALSHPGGHTTSWAGG